jgi:hypothetical protein
MYAASGCVVLGHRLEVGWVLTRGHGFGLSPGVLRVCIGVCVCLCCVVVFVLLQVLILFVLTAMKHISPAFSRNKSYYLSGSCHIKYYYLFECNHGVMSPVVIHVCFFDNVVSLCTTFCLL